MGKSGSAFEAILSYFIVQFWTIGLGAFWFSGRIWASGSPVADAATSRTVLLSSRKLGLEGAWSYVEPWQSHLLNGTLFGIPIGLMLLIVLVQRWVGKGIVPKFHLIPWALGLIVGTSFWLAVAKFGHS